MKAKTHDDTQELLDFLIVISTWPQRFYMSGPDPKTGKTVRPPGHEWLFAYGGTYSGCVSAATELDAIRKAKRLFVAQGAEARWRK